MQNVYTGAPSSVALFQGFLFTNLIVQIKITGYTKDQSNAWDAWRWRKYMWLAIHAGAITLRVSLHEDMTKLISVRGRKLQLEHRLLNHS